MNVKKFCAQYINQLKDLLDTFEQRPFEQLVAFMLEAYADENQIFVMGNGGSGATASHFASDINKGCCIDLDKRFKMHCLNDNLPCLSALANDIAYEVVFEEQLKNFFRPRDLVIGISGSGNSENVLRAVRYAAQNGGRTAGLCGFSGGQLASLVDVALVARSRDMQKIEDIHMVVVHMTMQALHRWLHPGL